MTINLTRFLKLYFAGGVSLSSYFSVPSVALWLCGKIHELSRLNPKIRNQEAHEGNEEKTKARSRHRISSERLQKNAHILIKLLSFLIRAHPRESVAKNFAALPRQG